MGAMFGGPAGGMAMPGMGGAPAAKKKKPALERKSTMDEPEEPMARVPMVPIPGMGMPGMTRSMSQESSLTAGMDEGHRGAEVSDEDSHGSGDDSDHESSYMGGMNELPDREELYSFPQFLRLPIELRHRIWDFVDPDLREPRRVFKLHLPIQTTPRLCEHELSPMHLPWLDELGFER